MNQEGREEIISKLRNEEAISIVRVIRDDLLDTIDGNLLPPEEEQVKAIYSLMQKYGIFNVEESEIPSNTKITEESIGESSRKLLLFISKNADSNLLNKLDTQLVNRPNARTAFAPVILGLPVVLSCCMAMLTLVSGFSYKNGEVIIDSTRGLKVLKANIKGIVDIIKNIIPLNK